MGMYKGTASGSWTLMKSPLYESMGELISEAVAVFIIIAFGDSVARIRMRIGDFA